MSSFGTFLFVYILGGLTFVPFILVLIFLYAYLTFPSTSQQYTEQKKCEKSARDGELQRSSDDQYSLKSGTDELAERFHRTHESDVAAGYFAVCREYVPGGVNGKPPERMTPAGEVIAAESPSVYQAMYRSLFDRRQAPSIEPSKNNGKNVKRARNVFYIVLRHGHLMLYDDANQVEVRYVISLAHHNVSIFGGEGEIQEGELWIKRNAICLSRRLDSLADLGGPTPPFYLFSENLSEKEDFYFAMLQNQARMGYSTDTPPKCQQFDVKHIIALVQRLHSSEQQLQTRWLNAVLGRLFLALYKTPQMEEFIRNKITKKISRVKKPNFVSKIGLQRIDMGEGAPFITNPRLKDLTVDGNCCVEADLQYTGNFRVELSATVRIDLGTRFKPREVDLVLAVVLKNLEGHGLVRFKPPPSNRCWLSFESMPHMVMDIEPIVSSKQITLGIVLRAIESRIREVVAESIVLPFWDDIPFLDTQFQHFRGGIWEPEPSKPKPDSDVSDDCEAHRPTQSSDAKDESIKLLKTKDDRASSVPILPGTSPASLTSRQSSKSAIRDYPKGWSASSSAVDKSGGAQLSPALRSQTFSNTADPVVTADTAKVDKATGDSNGNDGKSSAANSMIEVSSRSPPSSPNKTPNGSPPTDSLITPISAPHSSRSSVAESIKDVAEPNDESLRRPLSAHTRNHSGNLEDAGSTAPSSSVNDKPRRLSTLENLTRSISSSTSSEEKTVSSTPIGTATAMAKKWGWTMFGKGEHNASNPNRTAQEGSRQGTPENPIGRGHPFPPPGTPLPPPERFSFNRHNLPKRKPVQPKIQTEHAKNGDNQTIRKQSPPKRKPVINNSKQPEQRSDDILVVEAPCDSGPSSPATDVNNDADNTEQVTTDDTSTLKGNESDEGVKLDKKVDEKNDIKDEDSRDPEIQVPGCTVDGTECLTLANGVVS